MNETVKKNNKNWSKERTEIDDKISDSFGKKYIQRKTLNTESDREQQKE